MTIAESIHVKELRKYTDIWNASRPDEAVEVFSNSRYALEHADNDGYVHYVIWGIEMKGGDTAPAILSVELFNGWDEYRMVLTVLDDYPYVETIFYTHGMPEDGPRYE